MREVLEGSQAVARTVARCRPGVVCAYPISPQTHIVEALSVMARTGELTDCEYVNVESEFSAMSVSIGASAAGSRAYTATASQGLLYMSEAVFNAAGMGLPIVMTVANRAIGAPINIWNDHSDTMALRDAGWLQLFAADNQEAADLHVIAFGVAEELEIPAMVCMDGFTLTHATDVLELATQEQVDRFLPAYLPKQVLDIDRPTTIGTMAGPESFTETKYLQHLRFLDATEVIQRWSDRFFQAFGREAGGLVARYDPVTLDRDRTAAGATIDDVTVVAMGSVLGTLQAALPELRAQGVPVRLLGISSFRPFPGQALRDALADCRHVVVIDRALELGSGGVLTGCVGRALAGTRSRIHSVVAGLGGRPILEESLRDVVRRAVAGELGRLEFMDLKQGGIPAPAVGATEVAR
ncbi:transketolase C-terminal domain-containing protein [Demequina capsici]|uniref:Transketolase C-terminal domain-containing protein n=1 Tax=Demequina capsici TaxID=3075620 RepID=A0AA96FAQ6_9MICO|nr:transketolase C-terminal domain-containing protein [Demequina sp. OYTSA14]WNM25870.1 transketolase C-terminal domain-containing protein [Demequina sp. OYTSA14]